jgi:hypothetical protein
MLKRSAFRSTWSPPPRARDLPPPPAPSVRPLTAGTYGGPVGAPVVLPKPEPHRNRHLLDLARGMPCLLRIPGVCNNDWPTTVACHSNLPIHGKAKGRKADDEYTVCGCSTCHAWLDQGPVPAAEKLAAFMAAHLRQVQVWRLIAGPGRAAADRAAAQWALDHLNANPLGKIE